MERKFPHMVGKQFTNDVWLLTAPVGEQEKLANHIEWIVSLLKPHVGYLKEIQAAGGEMDISCSCKLRGEVTSFWLDEPLLRPLAEWQIPIQFLIIRAKA